MALLEYRSFRKKIQDSLKAKANKLIARKRGLTPRKLRLHFWFRLSGYRPKSLILQRFRIKKRNMRKPLLL